ncbi:site-specific DNA-methyltransferase [Planctomonas sp. JC2975]|uniref:site-specific DNA-methyltransferase n=1 Tax=Planctomonas sp. JC2975 TaxID=2729626 RepID=UPI0014733FB7|nr:site-specific DNA-methyltransferase [Planctomonas sp. JC2975]NNC12928.1 site-specific DNA-methyltransferase [Planctomonas sp. JC2975]
MTDQPRAYRDDDLSHAPADDRVEQNIDAIASLFPHVITELADESGGARRAIDFDLLRQELSHVVVDGPRERYRLEWPGKRAAAVSANTKATMRLRDDVAASVGVASSGGDASASGDGDSAAVRRAETAGNLIIAGDNLQALKLLRPRYAGAVKLIYIDPPYNTRNEFVYHDDFSVGVRAFRRRDRDAGRGAEDPDDRAQYDRAVDAGAVDAGARDDEHLNSDARDSEAFGDLQSEADSGGHLHSDWLSMMYPRLLLARDLLADDGVGFVSIDGNEVAQLKLLLAEVFGARNVLATIVWVSNLKGRQISDGGPAGTHEYILCFARNADAVARFRGSASDFHALMPAVYRNPGYAVKHDARGAYVTKNELYNTNSRFNERTAPTMVFRIHFHPGTGEVRVTDIDDDTAFDGFLTAMPHHNHRPGLDWHAWRWSRGRVLAEHDELEFDVSGGTLRIRTKVRDVDGMTMKDVVIGPNTITGQRDLDELGLHRLFDNPKPVSLLRTLVAVTTSGDDLVLDFFAGSGTTAQAVMEQNADDGGRRRFVLVQLDERSPVGSEAAAAGFDTLADVTIERVRRAGERLQSDAMPVPMDTGFRVQRLEACPGATQQPSTAPEGP